MSGGVVFVKRILVSALSLRDLGQQTNYLLLLLELFR